MFIIYGLNTNFSGSISHINCNFFIDTVYVQRCILMHCGVICLYVILACLIMRSSLAEKERDCRHCWFLTSGTEACLYGGEVDAHSVSTPHPTVNKQYSISATLILIRFCNSLRCLILKFLGCHNE